LPACSHSSYTRFGRYAYVIGGSEEIAKLSGIDVRKYRTIAFVISGMCCALAGALTASRTSIGSNRSRRRAPIPYHRERRDRRNCADRRPRRRPAPRLSEY
jgi:hypothetical protein